MPPILKKFRGHIALGLSMRPFVWPFKAIKVRVLIFLIDSSSKITDPIFFINLIYL